MSMNININIEYKYFLDVLRLEIRMRSDIDWSKRY